MFDALTIPCLCACECSGRTVLEPGTAPDRCVMCEAGDGCPDGFVSESEALDEVHLAGLAPGHHAVAVDALSLRYRPGARVDPEHEARVLALVGRA